MSHAYPHMCRDDHPEIGHRDSSEELCPLCRVLNALEHVTELLVDTWRTPMQNDAERQLAIIEARRLLKARSAQP